MFRGLLGILVILALAWIFSANRRAINWRLVAGGLFLQTCFALAFFSFGAQTQAVLDPIATFFAKLTSMSDEGAKMVFGAFASDEAMKAAFGNQFFIFAFRVLPTIIFFSALTSVLYYTGILQKIVFAMAWVMKRAMRLSGAESLAAAGEVFLGQTESALLIKPYIPKMTRSEILTLMVGGMATIAGGVMAAYIGMLSKGDPIVAAAVAKNLLCASLMNAPAAIVLAKILLPETEPVNTDLRVPREKMGENFFDALADGTTQGLSLALNIAAMLIAFIAVVALLNYFLGGIGQMPLGGDQTLNGFIQAKTNGLFSQLSLQSILGVFFAPLAWVIGVDGWQDSLAAGQLLGTKLALNEFVAYDQLGGMKASMDPKTVFLMQFALCGFANLGSVGIQLGGISTICPEKRATLANLGMRALMGGTLATLLSASLAGIFFQG